ncbi:uncharacterized protein LOC117999373 isoform X4 [Mirounga leonina]|uniref:uncharacterized protein LOC117999373 isoform X4 n=1 Tax=Mirounga leonina TaxID=9715 RepID=UPI00156C4ADC|nr:uncharacterized protein LOC117999373 isoform X4 [Mirounga leonina]
MISILRLVPKACSSLPWLCRRPLPPPRTGTDVPEPSGKWSPSAGTPDLARSPPSAQMRLQTEPRARAFCFPAAQGVRRATPCARPVFPRAQPCGDPPRGRSRDRGASREEGSHSNNRTKKEKLIMDYLTIEAEEEVLPAITSEDASLPQKQNTEEVEPTVELLPVEFQELVTVKDEEMDFAHVEEEQLSSAQRYMGMDMKVENCGSLVFWDLPKRNVVVLIASGEGGCFQGCSGFSQDLKQ